MRTAARSTSAGLHSSRFRWVAGLGNDGAGDTDGYDQPNVTSHHISSHAAGNRHFFKSVVQFKTTVIGVDVCASTGTLMRKR